MVAFSINITLDISGGAIVNVLVADKVAVLVTLKYIALAGSEPPSKTVAVAVSSASEGKQANVPYPKASPINSKLVLVLAPQVRSHHLW